MLRRPLLAAALGFAAALLAGPAGAQEWPQAGKTIQLIVPAPGGSGTGDTIARVLAEELQTRLKTTIVVDNKAGANGNIGATAAAQTPGDGYHFLFSWAGTLAVNKSLYKNLSFDAQKDFVPILLVADVPNILVVNNDIPARDLAEFEKYAKANPGKLNFGSPGNGTAMHLSGEMFKSAAGINVVHVPYKGTQPVLTGLLAGEVAYTFDTGIAMEMVKAGRLKALAVTTPQRTALLPDLPTLAESGLPGFVAQSWYGFLAPAGTPAEVVDKLGRDINEVLQGPTARASLARIVLEPQGTTPAQFEQFLKDDIVKWRQVIKESGAKAD